MSLNMNLNMDSLVNRLRNTVSQVAHQVNSSVNTIIPGNLIHREYETIRLRCSHGCPGFVWSIYDSIKRDSASLKASLKDAISPNLISVPISGEAQGSMGEKQLFSVFIFDKSQIDNLSSKADKEAVLEHIRRGVTQLTRLRHPAILTVHHPLEESRSSLAFVTEHVFGHLESILKEQRISRIENRKETNLVDLSQDQGPKDSDYKNDSCQLDEIQIKAGLLHVCDGLKFIHNDAKLLHRNICFDNVFVDSNNTWKIAGFDFSCQQTGSTGTEVKNSNILEFATNTIDSPLFPSLRTIYPPLPSSISPNWSCSAPEHSNSDQVTLSSDIYSLGIMTCALLGKDKDMTDLSYEYGLISDTYKRGIHFREIADRLPTSIKGSLIKFASINVESRPSLEDFQNLSVFNDQQVQAIRDLDSQFAWDRLKKIDFFRRLQDVLPKLSHQVKVNRIARSLFNEVLIPDMVPHVLPSILIITKDSTPTEFRFKIFPNLKGPFRILEPKSVPIMLLDNLEMLADRAKLCLAEFQSYAFTLIQYLLRSDQQLQEKSLTVLPKVKRFIDENSLHNLILPEMSRLAKETNTLSIRVKCLESISQMVDVMEKNTITRSVLPLVFETPCHHGELAMQAMKIIKTAANNSRADFDREILASKILPFLIPLTVVNDLNLQQFESIVVLIKSLLDRVERDQRSSLARKSQVANSKSNAMVLESFQGSSHFLLD